jgi:hypothetical protein
MSSSGVTRRKLDHEARGDHDEKAPRTSEKCNGVLKRNSRACMINEGRPSVGPS